MNRNFKRRLLAGLFIPAVGLSVGTALAQTSSGMSASGTSSASGAADLNAAAFDRLDTNKDGTLSREEAQADPAMRDAWSSLDAKNSGAISRDDFTRYLDARKPGAPASGASGSGAPK